MAPTRLTAVPMPVTIKDHSSMRPDDTGAGTNRRSNPNLARGHLAQHWKIPVLAVHEVRLTMIV